MYVWTPIPSADRHLQNVIETTKNMKYRQTKHALKRRRVNNVIRRNAYKIASRHVNAIPTRDVFVVRSIFDRSSAYDGVQT